MDVLGRLDTLCQVTRSPAGATIVHPSRTALALADHSVGFAGAFDNGPRAYLFATRVKEAKAATDLKVAKMQYLPDGFERRHYMGDDGVCRPAVTRNYIRVVDAVLRVVRETWPGERVVRSRSKKTPAVIMSPSQVNRIEELCGQRIKLPEARAILDAEVAQRRWTYKAGTSHELAGYTPFLARTALDDVPPCGEDGEPE